MTKQELLRALEPFDDDTFIAVKFKTIGNPPYFEMPIFKVDYERMQGDIPAYVTLRTSND